MCDVSWSAQPSARPEMKKLRTTSDGRFLLSWVPYGVPKWIKALLCQKIFRRALACICMHRRAPTCNASQSRKNVCDVIASAQPSEQTETMNSKSPNQKCANVRRDVKLPSPLGRGTKGLERAWGSTRKTDVAQRPSSLGKHYARSGELNFIEDEAEGRARGQRASHWDRPLLRSRSAPHLRFRPFSSLPSLPYVKSKTGSKLHFVKKYYRASACTCAHRRAPTRSGSRSSKNMCDVLPSAQPSART
jgi:hypothetical protein